jgi:hypothetical protein
VVGFAGTGVEMAKEGARHLVSNIGGVLAKDDVLNSTEACVSHLLVLPRRRTFLGSWALAPRAR